MASDVAPPIAPAGTAAQGARGLSPGRFVAWFLATFGALGAINVGLSLHFGPIVGDLARVGGFAERDYAPRAPQPAEELAPNDVALGDADVVVLGDSFSNRLYWQGSYEALTGRRTLTFQYGEAGCIANWLAWMHAQPLKPGAEIIIESVERSFVPRFSHPAPCPPITPRPMRRNLAPAGTSWFDGGITLDIGNQARTLVHALGVGHQDQVDTGQVVNAALARTDRFTNRRNDRVLYLAEDAMKLEWRPEQVASALDVLRREQAAFAARGVRFRFLLMPDKSSIYRDDLRAPRIPDSGIARALHDAGVSTVDTQACLRGLAQAGPDLYLPDDQHLGTAGYAQLARLVADDRCPAPNPPRR